MQTEPIITQYQLHTDDVFSVSRLSPVSTVTDSGHPTMTAH